MKIFCPVWGDKHISLLRHALGLSLKWPKNAAAIEGSEWIISTSHQREVEQIKGILREIDPKNKAKFYVADIINQPHVDPGMILVEIVRRAIEQCLEEKEA